MGKCPKGSFFFGRSANASSVASGSSVGSSFFSGSFFFSLPFFSGCFSFFSFFPFPPVTAWNLAAKGRILAFFLSGVEKEISTVELRHRRAESHFAENRLELRLIDERHEPSIHVSKGTSELGIKDLQKQKISFFVYNAMCMRTC